VDEDILHQALDRTLFPGIPFSVLVHAGFGNAHKATANSILAEVKKLVAQTSSKNVVAVKSLNRCGWTDFTSFSDWTLAWGSVGRTRRVIFNAESTIHNPSQRRYVRNPAGWQCPFCAAFRFQGRSLYIIVFCCTLTRTRRRQVPNFTRINNKRGSIYTGKCIFSPKPADFL
jgi:hypothetical protein